ncbi:class I SAM-dependent methyltransferase [Breznakiella homolactica]|uniref:Class I SAM-dependent methyltransferase n=1 Tax=Breznakiella homolactica TaxID=2798577 RepID=A0A7T7XRN9_9SPIR|nr:class I SAM-dependent methyltransferase [Breznakiella homolactica]QQO11261.1 class I SAM-dependent methyltransferase [Breznakiella homolactica]
MGGKTVKTWSTPPAAEPRNLIPCAVCGSETFRLALDCGDFSYVRCGSCSLIQMNPQPAAEAVADRYGAAFGSDYLEYELANETAFLGLQKKALEDIRFDAIETEIIRNSPEKPRFLDVGCATGALLEYIRGRGWVGTGIEICGPSAAYARETRGLDIRELPLEKNRFPEDSFEIVHASHLIEHLNNPRAFTEEVRRILVPGGKFLVTTPNIAGFQAKLFRERWRSAIFDHLYLFSRETLKKLLEQSGFTVTKTVTWGGLAAGIAPLPVKRIMDSAAKRFGFGDVMMILAEKR